MRLERYNQVLIALVGTLLLIGVLAAAAGATIAALARHQQRGITIPDANPRAKLAGQEKLVICPPVQVPGSDYEYFPIAAVVLSDANRTPMVSANLAVRESYDRAYLPDYLTCGSDYRTAGRIFNVVIRNSKTAIEVPLLKKPAQVVALLHAADDCKAVDNPLPCGLLLWELRPKDSNHDGVIDDHDAVVAYVSDLSGNNLRRISPENATVLNARWLQKSNLLALEIRTDDNHDGEFTEEDGATMMATDGSNPTEVHPLLSGETTTLLKQDLP